MISPIIGIQAFIIGYIAIIFIARLGVEAYVWYTDNRGNANSPTNRGNDQAGIRTTSNAVQRYYNRKGA